MVSSFACVPAGDVPLSAPAGPRDARASAREVVAADGRLGFRGAHRLLKTDDFSSVFASRKTIRGKYFDLSYRPNEAGSARLGLIVAKKHARSAVDRNLTRRIVRESFRLCRCKLPTLDIIVRLSSRIDKPDRRGLRLDIDGLFSRLMQ